MSVRFRGIGLALIGLATALGIGIELAGAQAARELTAPAASPADTVRFATLDVFVDSAEPLAAWQFELTEATGAMAVVGIENGDSEAFAGTPRYDRDAVAEGRADRIVVADYSLADRAVLPSGRTRVATVHVRLTGPRAPEFELELVAAGNASGDAIAASAAFQLQNGREP